MIDFFIEMWYKFLRTRDVQENEDTFIIEEKEII